MNTQTHIVYRNRAEHDFYESGMMIPLFGGLAAGFVTMLVLCWIAGRVTQRISGPSGLVVGASCVVSVCVGLLAFNWLLI